MLYNDNDWLDDGGSGDKRSHYNYCWMENITYGGVYAVQYIVSWENGAWVYTMQAVWGPVTGYNWFTKGLLHDIVGTRLETFIDQGIWQDESDWTAI